jgi:hypothetical protein
VKLVEGVTWVPELLDHNTEEWQHLASDVQQQVSLSRSVCVVLLLSEQLIAI